MKKLFVAVVALTSLLFVSCNKESNYPSLIQGTWEVKTATSAFTKNGQPATAETFIKDITGSEVEIPQTVKEELQQLFNSLSSSLVFPEGTTITFKDGKVSAGSMESGSYTINGNALTISGDGQSIPFNIITLTATDMVLTVDMLNNSQYSGTVSQQLQILKNAGYAMTSTLNFKKK